MESIDHTVISPRSREEFDNDSRIYSESTIIELTKEDCTKLDHSVQDEATQIELSNKPLHLASPVGLNQSQQLQISFNNQYSNHLIYQSDIINAAMPIIDLVNQLKLVDEYHSIQELSVQLIKLLKNFHHSLNNKVQDKVLQARASYILCSFADESILNTSWGQMSEWSQCSLLSQFHNETYGGEKIFQIINIALADPQNNIELLNLLYLVISYGFKGKLKLSSDAKYQSEQLRIKLYQTLSHYQKPQEKLNLSETYQIIQEPNTKHLLNYYIIGCILILSIACFYLYYHLLIDLNKQSDTTALSIAQINPAQEAAPTVNYANFDIENSLHTLLSKPIANGDISLKDFRNHSLITLSSESLFGSGSAKINKNHHELLDDIASALATVGGKIVVVGHTDNISIRTAQFPSNWHLSLARASNVASYMQEKANLKDRILAKGKGATSPIASNDSAEGRAKNRRVTIKISRNNR